MAPTGSQLARELGTFGALFMGLGAMLGTGIFVAIGLAAGHAGAGLLPAIALAAALAACNALSSAQLAASHPVSGGTYEYGCRYLTPAAGAAAGWMFLCAKTASAASAALGLAGYLLALAGIPSRWLHALTNLAALRMPAHERLYPRALARAGLAGCLGLAWWVPARTWLAGLAVLAAGLAWHAVAMRMARR